MRNVLYIPSIDAKDLYLSNNYIDRSPYGYKLSHKGNVNLKKYKNSFDYSLDLIELRKVADEVYGKRDCLSFASKNKEYSFKVINVTYNYAVKEFNEISKNFYVKLGYDPLKVELHHGYAFVRNQYGVNELIAIKTNEPYYNPIPDDVVVPTFFQCEYDVIKMTYIYKQSGAIKTIMSGKDLRKWTYREGFYCNGLHFRRFKRSSGSARVGKCLFIDERLYPKMHESEICGLDVKVGDELDIAAFEAYISLPTSSIIDTINIEPKNILVIDDWESVFEDDAVCTDLEDNWLTTSEKKMKVSNSIWDGQSLIDVSLLGKYADKGMVLLRNKFFKSCCFNTNIQKFFADNNITSVEQLNGKTIATDISDIKLITTPSSIKYFKFGKLEDWLKNIWSYFGVVKYDKNTHFFDGRMVQVHYQLLNTLQLSREDVQNIVQDSINYISLLNTDTDVMRYHLKFKEDCARGDTNVMPDNNSIVYNLLGYKCGIENTSLYYSFKKELCRAYIKNIKRGHVLVDGTYATLLGNPYEMLLQSIGKFDGTSILKHGTVHNTRYKYGTEILGSRSPHVTIGNILITTNVECMEIDKYFNLTPNIICINSINENILERLSGADFDSDTVLITNNKILVECAKKNYMYFKVPTRNINPPKSKRHYTPDDLCDLDFKTSENKIGEIVNLSQELNSLIWNIIYHSGGTVMDQYDSIKEIYYDVCQLDVMSNLEIDKAKKEYTVDMVKELKKIRDKYSSILTSEDGRKKMPQFLGYIAETKNYRNDNKKDYSDYNTSMDYLIDCFRGVRSNQSQGSNFIKLSEIFRPIDFDKDKVNKKQVANILEEAKKRVAYNKTLYINPGISSEDKKFYRQMAKEDFLYELNRMKINGCTMYRLLQQAENLEDMATRNYIFYILFNYKNNTLIEILSQYEKINTYLEPTEEGEISIYGFNFAKKVPPEPFLNGQI